MPKLRSSFRIGCPPTDSMGFTLIELMILAAFIAIILTVALPVYTNYTIRAKIDEALSIAGATKTAVAAACIENPTIETVTFDHTGYQFASPTSFVASITLSGPCTRPVITIQTQQTGATPDPLITLTGQLGDGRMEFVCASSGVNTLLPAECRS